ncbi:hypothetical protein PR202_gb08452 [Eleusine coracana subsp. coracana]|uniref:Uncharacterized protein n=1 Tax=Eleusine coracana subsp. coracana TaxID=191504 RepID=A0AAV5EEM0_ELECO|nr:hypothetical protein QOZ80_2BG0185410 [Eleusine coracana subsp. coracana]GJN21007.1 hypothetical protein PR202_gb08452 [Eleusine coracana subsp. coracana]
MEQQKPVTKATELDASAISRSARLQATGSDELGQSCRVYLPATGKVPFVWEDEPGKPKSSSARLDDVPPLCPSPAMQSARLTRGRRRKAGKHSSETGGFEGCIPLRFNLGRAMKRWM